MNAWLIYVMMLADSVSGSLQSVTIVSIAAMAASLFACTLLWTGDDEPPKQAFRWLKIAFTTFIVSLTINCFVPSTKTVAMMIVIPRIATEKNLDAMGGEAKEIYQLAKDALKKAASEPLK